MKPLSDLKQGEIAYIVDLRCSVTGLEVLDLGLFPGDEIRVLYNDPSHSEMIFMNDQKLILIQKRKANTIITHLVSYEFNLN
jgi:hypothetical protein